MPRRTVLPMLAAMLCLIATPARADDDKTVGILAGVGIAAASGKTTLGAGAGAIEAGLLDAEAFQQAGAIIAATVNRLNVSPTRPVVILAHDEKLDLVMPTVIRKRLGELRQLVVASCSLPPPQAPQPSPLDWYLKAQGFAGDNARFQGADLVAAVATETAIGAVTLTAEDRLLINALLMNAGQTAAAPTAYPAAWTPAAPALPTLSATYVVPGEPVAYDAGAPVVVAYDVFQTTLTAQRLSCKSTEGKAAIGVADAFAASLNAPSEKGPAPLVAALQLDAISQGNPLLLRLAIEQIGGTTITTAGLLYTFGWPNAATVGAGLKVSFRLVDPKAARMKAVGEIRCVVRQTNIKKVADVVAAPSARSVAGATNAPGKTVCDYRVAT